LRFPTVSGHNLLQNRVTLPEDFAGQLNLVVIAFERWQQSRVDTWLPFISQIERINDAVRYYQLATYQQTEPLAPLFGDESTWSGTFEPVARERTIMFFADRPAFRRALELPNEDDIYVVLIDRQGNILWRTEGAFASEKVASLAAVLQASQHDTPQ
jgi:hypothetical protein